MYVTCDKCHSGYNDEYCWTICPHGPLWAGPGSYCKKHDLVDCIFCKPKQQSKDNNLWVIPVIVLIIILLVASLFIFPK